MSVTGTPIVSPLAGYYADLDDLYAVAGQTNVDTYSDLDGTGARDDARVQKALDWADAEIDRRFRQVGLTVPIVESHPSFEQLTEAAARFAAFWLYRARGSRDVGEGQDDQSEYYSKMNGWKKAANAILNRLCIPGRMDTDSTPDISAPNSVVV